MARWIEIDDCGDEYEIVDAEDYDALAEAAKALYMAGRWTCGKPAAEEARLWESLRDALGLEPGTATSAGVAVSADVTP